MGRKGTGREEGEEVEKVEWRREESRVWRGTKGE